MSVCIGTDWGREDGTLDTGRERGSKVQSLSFFSALSRSCVPFNCRDRLRSSSLVSGDSSLSWVEVMPSMGDIDERVGAGGISFGLEAKWTVLCCCCCCCCPDRKAVLPVPAGDGIPWTAWGSVRSPMSSVSDRRIRAIVVPCAYPWLRAEDGMLDIVDGSGRS